MRMTVMERYDTKNQPNKDNECLKLRFYAREIFFFFAKTFHRSILSWVLVLPRQVKRDFPRASQHNIDFTRLDHRWPLFFKTWITCSSYNLQNIMKWKRSQCKKLFVKDIYEIHHILHCGYEIKWNHVVSQWWAQISIASRSLKIFQDFNGIWTRDLAIPVRCSNQLSYEATDVGSWSLLSSQLPVISNYEWKIYMKYIIYCIAGMKSNETMLSRSDERKFLLRREAWKWTQKWPAPNVSGFIAQLVRASYRYREVAGSNPVEVLKIFQASRRNRKFALITAKQHGFIWFHTRSAIYDVFHIYLSLIITYHGKLWTQKWPAPNVSGFIAQLVRASYRYREVAGSNPVEVLKNFQASRRNRNLRSSLQNNMVSFDFIPAVQYMMYFIYIFHS